METERGSFGLEMEDRGSFGLEIGDRGSFGGSEWKQRELWA